MATDTQTAPPLPFEVASQYSTRQSFTVPDTVLAASALTPLSPIQVPAVGYLEGMLLQVSVACSGGTTPQLTDDGPWSVIQSINFRNAAGVNLIAPMTGYNLYLMNKYGGQGTGFGPYADPKFGRQYAGDPDSATINFFLWVPLGIDLSEGYGVVPALSSAANYQLEIMAGAVSAFASGAPSATLSIDATAYYFDLPAAMGASGAPQSTTPPGTPATSVWQIESPTVSPGTQLVKSNNVGNVIRNHILVLRNSSGVRIDTNGWPALFELYLDNNPRFSFSHDEFEFMMTRWFGLGAASKDVVGGLDTGVYVLPYHALLGSASGDPANTRAQLLTTLDATLLQFRAQDFGSAASRLEIITQVITTTDAGYLYSK